MKYALNWEKSRLSGIAIKSWFCKASTTTAGRARLGLHTWGRTVNLAESEIPKQEDTMHECSGEQVEKPLTRWTDTLCAYHQLLNSVLKVFLNNLMKYWKEYRNVKTTSWEMMRRSCLDFKKQRHVFFGAWKQCFGQNTMYKCPACISGRCLTESFSDYH